jgi:hypothetical protein
MKDPDNTNGDLFADKMQINFHVLGALMLNRVGGEVDGGDIVTVDKAGRLERMVEFLKKLSEP